jgi:hypothetical protein
LDMRQSLNIGWWRYAHHQQHSLVLGCINARRRTKVRGKSSIKRQAAGCEPPLNCRGETDHSRTFAPQCSGARQGQSTSSQIDRFHTIRSLCIWPRALGELNVTCLSAAGTRPTHQREAVKDGARAILIGGVEHAAKAVMRSSAAGLGP